MKKAAKKKRKRAERKPQDASAFSRLKELITPGNIAAAIGVGMTVFHALRAEGGAPLDTINQDGKPIVLKYLGHPLLDGGTRSWEFLVDGKPFAFTIDSNLDSEAPGSILKDGYRYEFGGANEKRVLDVVQGWLDQFWDRSLQKRIFERTSEFDGPGDRQPYDHIVAAAKELADTLKSRQKK